MYLLLQAVKRQPARTAGHTGASAKETTAAVWTFAVMLYF